MKPAMIGEKIKNIRQKCKLSQARFGKKLGISGKTISAYETGRIYPTLRILEKIKSEYDSEIVDFETDSKEYIREKMLQIESILARIERALPTETI
ncbi:helix-turn-helix transcriptional regulator [Patescibacteria group bacterium]|nr:helix-turn-helix transcriptional regulator [Patescibacteria group bacterium]